MKTHILFAVAILSLVLTGCAGNEAQIEAQADYHGVSKPSQVMVGQFAYAANDPTPDQTILNRMNSQYVPSLPQTPQDQAAQAVAQTMQNSLIKNLAKAGILSTPTINNVVPPPGTLIIEGELLTVKQGGGLQRLSSGLGSGYAHVVSYVSAYLVEPNGHIVPFAKFYSNTQTSVDPGVQTDLIVGPAAGYQAANSGGTADTLTSRGVTATADAKLIARQIARKINKLFTAEGWNSLSSPN